MNKLIELLKVEQDTFDNMETESAPSGEWEEYNYPYMIQEAMVDILEQAIVLVGSCSKCIYFDSNMKDYCRRLNITTSSEWYCGDFK